jgi:hypothetical protein
MMMLGTDTCMAYGPPEEVAAETAFQAHGDGLGCSRLELECMASHLCML